MPLLSRKTDYALLILWSLCRRSEGENARTIADGFGLSRPFVANILKELCHSGLVASHRGVKGGYLLRPGAENTTVAELLEAMGEGFRLTLCSEGHADGSCALEGACPVQGPLASIHHRMIDVLRAVTLAELFASSPEPPRRPGLSLALLSDAGDDLEPALSETS